MTIGQCLAEARARSGLSIAALEERTRIRGQVIAAIERDEFGPCGGDFYARGHIRQLARTLGLDPQPLLADFAEQVRAVPASGGAGGPHPPPETGAVGTVGAAAGPRGAGSAGATSEAIQSAPRRRMRAAEIFRAHRSAEGTEPPRVRWTLLMALASVVVLLLGVAQALFGSYDSTERSAPSEVTQEQEGPVERSVSPAPPDTLEAGDNTSAERASTERYDVTTQPTAAVKVRAVERTWLSVRNSHGGELFAGILTEGQSRGWRGPEQLSLRLGNAGGVHVTASGEILEPPERQGGVSLITVNTDGIHQDGSAE
ncbi:DUF4115 domain-containing protein [Lipingzhangella sp. LS1_29]|uniref:DUF4115 domain-containing protein n=1 Tax=Lipingzhangella rawalii TaxID=2055835 RepID=A0ABU2H8Q8_9ACTN|nr:RodZ domain-containing protein [Lipingzhangella rawalii]MDS1271692.1 DUF4115 domain-containing protein [Lipingzhangella rawalii]